jgi:ATP-dependent Lhr-like helicase
MSHSFAALGVSPEVEQALAVRGITEPFRIQTLVVPDALAGRDVLGQAPTGSGKTLAAFLYGIDRLNEAPGQGLRLLYVSPLKALNYDVERNLRGPLAGLRSELTVGVRTGDTPQRERQQMLRRPPDVLITTPESLFLLLTSQARETLRSVRTLILDEVHAVAGTKRGAHLALSVERLEHLVEGPLQRIALSATQRPLEEIGRFVSGGRPIRLVDAGRRKQLDLQVVVPVEDMREPGGGEEVPALPAPERDTPAPRRSRCSAPAARGRARRSGRRSTRSCCGSSSSTARRSCSSTTGASPSGSRCG